MPSGARLEASHTARRAPLDTGKAGTHLRGPRAMAARRRAEQVMADQPVVGDLPDLAPGRRSDLEATREVLADPADSAERQLESAGRGRDRCDNLELHGQLRETQLDPVLAG